MFFKSLPFLGLASQGVAESYRRRNAQPRGSIEQYTRYRQHR